MFVFFWERKIFFDYHFSLLSLIGFSLFLYFFLHSGKLILIDGDCRVVVEALSGQHLGQVALAAGGLLQFCAFVLEPDLDLGLVEAELG